MNRTVFGSGLVAADHIFLKRDATSKPDYLGTSGGGSVGNTQTLLSLLGYDCGVFGVVGNDIISDIIRSDFDLFHVSHSLLAKRGSPGEYVESRQYSHQIDEKRQKHSFKMKCLRCAEDFHRRFRLAWKDVTSRVREAAKTADAIHVDRANQITIDLATDGRERGVPVAVDLGYATFKREMIVKKLLDRTTLAKLNSKVFEEVVGESGRKGVETWRDLFPKVQTLVVTDGRNGVYGYSTSGSRVFPLRLPAIPCRKVRDESGAGDILMAVLISELLLNNRGKSKKTILRSINRGQALASLNCSLYGARSLSRVFLRLGIDKGEVFDIADEIIEDGEAGSHFDPKMGIPKKFRYSFRFSPGTSCSVCGSPRSKTKAKRQVRKHSVYIADLGKSFLAMSRSFEMGIEKRDRFEALRTKPSLFVGSGGSLSAALFGEQLLLKLYGIPSKAVPPFHLRNLKVLNRDTPVCILSYGGNNPDIIKSAALRVAKADVDDCLVLCGSKNSELARIAEERKWDLILLPGQERAFVSTVGMLAMISSLISLLIPEGMFEDVGLTFEHESLMNMLGSADRVAAEDSVRIFRSSPQVHLVCLASGWGMPALADFESKIIEGGICTVEASEMKNFTHGRYISTFRDRDNRAIVLFESPEERELSIYLTHKFKRHVQPIVHVRTDKEGVSGALELMIKGLYLAWHVGKRKDLDIGSPYKYPPEARGLYGWQPRSEEKHDFNDLLDDY